MKILSALVLLFFASLPARADSVKVTGSASWQFSSQPGGLSFGPGTITQTFNVSFDYDTVSAAISRISVSSSGPMGPFSAVLAGNTASIFNWVDPLGDGIQVGTLGIGNPNLPFPDVGSQLQIVIDF